MSPNSTLPTELLHEIYKYVILSSRSSAVTLCLVSRDARDIALPEVLRTVALHSPRSVRIFRNRVMKARNLRRGNRQLAALVRNLLVAPTFSDDPVLAVKAVQVILGCPNVQSLAIPLETLANLMKQEQHLRLAPRPTQLTLLDLNSKYDTILVHKKMRLEDDMFSAVTHVTIPPPPRYWRFYPRMPSHTHLAIFSKTYTLENDLAFTTHLGIEAMILVDVEGLQGWPPYVHEIQEAIRQGHKISIASALGGTLAEHWEMESLVGQTRWERASRDVSGLQL